MTQFSFSLTVPTEAIDELNHVNNLYYLKWVIEAAKKHWESVAPKDFRDSYYWVVKAHKIEYMGVAVLSDELTISTYVRKWEGVKSYRIVEIYRASTQRLLTKAETTWCLINAHTHRPARIPNILINVFKE